eukprot:2759496-Alexandrium_andersonii.AAC.1
MASASLATEDGLLPLWLAVAGPRNAHRYNHGKAMREEAASTASSAHALLSSIDTPCSFADESLVALLLLRPLQQLTPLTSVDE